MRRARTRDESLFGMSAHEHESARASRAERASSFARVADEYDRGRPSYPREAIEWLLGTEPLDVLDLGAGTGKLTGALLAAGHRVLAVEPLAEMRAILIAALPDAQALAGTAEALPLADASVDAVTAGSAFHWFDERLARAEIARVLRPPGVLGLLGNGFDTSSAWVARVREILGPPAIQRPGHWPAVEDLREDYVEVEDREFPHEQLIDRASLRDLASSRSSLALLSVDQRERVLAGLDRLWEQEPELIGRTQALLPWRTRARRCSRLR
jgi:ubiquinone/menaquinone biosynthesis C-methylase UbiE